MVNLQQPVNRADTAPNYFDSLLASTRQWTPPVYPDVMDPQWQALFTDSNDLQKMNLAKSWLWLFCNDAKYHDYANAFWFTEHTLESLRPWLVQIQPCLDEDFFSKVLKGHASEFMQTFFNKSGEYSHQNRLWFGTLESRMELIREMTENSRLLHAVSSSTLCQNRLWETLDEGAASETERAMVVDAAILHGLRRYRPNETDCTEQAGWVNFGYIGSARSTDHPRVPELERLKAFFITKEPAEIVEVFLRTWRLMVAEDADFRAYMIDIGAPEKTAPHEALFAVLEKWFPTYAKLWAIGTSLGLDVNDLLVEVKNYISTGHQAKRDKTTNLPQDISVA